jgi:hypothetical protein
VTDRKEIERIVPAALFPEPPLAGMAFASVSGTTAFVVTKSRRMIGAPNRAKGESLRVFGHRLSAANLPAGTTAMPWPKPAVRAPSQAAREVMGPHLAPVTLQAKQAAERKRLIANKRSASQADAKSEVPAAQILTGHARSATWRDPADLNVQRRFAKEISGHRAGDAIKMLVDNNAINRKQARVADRLRRHYEQGVIGMRGGPKWDFAPSGFGPSLGPSEIQCQALEHYNRAMGALGRLGDIVLCCCLDGVETLSAYATRTGINRQVASGRLASALDVLMDHYDRVDGDAKVSQRSIASNPFQHSRPADVCNNASIAVGSP